MKKYLLLASVASLGLTAGAQVQMSMSDEFYLADMKGDAASTLSLQTPTVLTTGALIEFTDETTLDNIRRDGGEVKNIYGKVAVVVIPVDKVADVFGAEGVVNATIDRPAYLRNDKARIVTDVDKVHLGEDLEMPYDGTGVIIAAYDSGLDPNHIAFKDSEGVSRVARAYKYGRTSYVPQTYVPAHMIEDFRTQNPGESVYDITGYKSDDDTETHGTHVLGIMGGSFCDPNSDMDLRGMAPGAEIVMGGGPGSQSNMLDAAQRVADYAKAVGKPAVFNLSWGNNLGAHDATDPIAKGLDGIVEETGLHVFMAAGNEGDQKIGIYKELTEDDNVIRTFLSPSDYLTDPYGVLGINGQALGTVTVWSQDDTPFEVYLDIVELANPGEPIYSLEIPANTRRFMVNGNTPSGVNASQVDRNVEEFNTNFAKSYAGGFRQIYGQNNRYHAELAFYLSTTSASRRTHAMALRVVGKAGQRIQIYAEPYQGYFMTYLTDRGKEGYTDSNGDGTYNSLAGGNKIVSVGAYSSRQGGQSYQGYVIYPAETQFPGVTSFSSWGHQQDGSLRPHVIAPGYVIYSTCSTPYMSKVGSYATAYGTPSVYEYYDAGTAKTYHWTIMAGTSQASPHMAGIAALWLQADPTLTYDQMLDVIRHSTTKPENASEQWGPNGLVNAYEGIKYILGGFNDLQGVIVDKSHLLIQNKGNGVYEIASPAESSVTAGLYNIQGVQVAASTGSGNCVELSTQGLAPGVYVLSAQSEGSATSKKIYVK